jgi:hypothetical protein
VVDFKLIYKREGKKFGGFCTFACFAHSLCTYVNIIIEIFIIIKSNNYIEKLRTFDHH